MTDNFDDLRPYNDSELPSALARIASTQDFEYAAAFVYPNLPVQDVRRLFCSFTTVQDFQVTVMHDVVRRIIDTSITDLTLSGAEYLKKNEAYVFVSNHRDIVLDALLLQYLLWTKGLPMFQTTFGSNLMQIETVNELGRCNRMFRTERNEDNPRQFFAAMQRLSAYIRHTVTNCGESVWIAQRNGRTKDGNDTTEVALIKMLGMSGDSGSKAEDYARLHIVPISIAYEWESCDILKTIELCRTHRDGHYIKSPNEDTQSILTGIQQPKGHVHLSICQPIEAADLASLPQSSKELPAALAQLIDHRIRSAYHLMPTNYAAHDLQSGASTYAGHYSPALLQQFQQHLNQIPTIDNIPAEVLRQQLIDIYATPVDNAAM
ncbi:MAG: 1-acyl-sn-glycerol-3-phosphate acyltransferase [Bacteroidales bacterium]|nr:1-acyl-sn-glycerol-3-phosphate acyltransferase [Bacteroidales bacterium]